MMSTNKIRIISLTLIALFALFLSSCLKDKGPASENNYSHSPALVGFQYQNFSSVPLVAAIFGTAEDTLSVEVTLSVASLTLNSPVTFTISPYKDGLDSFNTAQGSSYEQLDPTLYTLQNGGNITINPGQQIVTMRINFAGDKIDFTKQSGIGLQITNVKGASIATNLNVAIVTITQKSIYQGNYHVFGNRHHPTLGDFPFDYNADMGTIDPTTIDGAVEADLQTDLQIQVNPDNTVTLSSSSSFTPFLQAGKDNKYDPATKTFTLNYYYNSSAPRLISETLVLN